MRKLSFFIGGILLALTINATSNSYGRVRLPGNGKVEHNGDYIVYQIDFEARCYEQRTDAITNVSEGVTSLVSWLDNRAAHDYGRLDYLVNMIQTTKDNNPYLGYYGDDEKDPNPCYQKYSTTQSLSITITRAEDGEISAQAIQDFYNELYGYLWGFNSITEEGSNSYSQAYVSHVNKGLFEETIEILKEKAYAKAMQQATRNLLALLGETYNGQWFLEKADFTNDRNNYETHVRLDKNMDSAPSPIATPTLLPDPVPSIIKLDELSYSVEGSFEFGFTYDFNEANP